MARASVVIPTWNEIGLLRAALDSLRAQSWRDFDVVVVDNGSTDGTAAALETDYPEVRVISFTTNRGFAAAVNAGIRSSESDIVVLMNNDVEADTNWLAALVTVLDTQPQAAACASRMLCYSDRGHIDSAGDQLGFFAWSIGHGEPDGPEFSREREILSASAGAAAYRRRALEDVGLFDERFFAYLEDVDLGVRLQLAGWSCVYVPDAIVYHHGSATARRVPDLKLFLLMRNSLFIYFQYFPLRMLVLYGPAILCWPFYRVLRDRRSPLLAARALAAFTVDLAAVLRRRSSVKATRRISDRQFRSLLTGPLVSGRHPGPAAEAT